MNTVLHAIDAAANDSDKSITVPDGEVWQLDWLHAMLQSTATVGNRQLVLGLYDNAGIPNFYGDWHAGTTQAASLARHYMFQPGMYRETAFVDGEIQIAIPQKLVAHPGWIIRVYDSAAVDAAADDLTIAYQVTKLREA
jgi:hypothetical protein